MQVLILAERVTDNVLQREVTRGMYVGIDIGN